MTEEIKLEWRYRSTRDIEFATAKYKGFEIQVEDCDGDFSCWHVKRGEQFLVVGECGSTKNANGDFVYHMDAAMARAIAVFGYIWKAVRMNDFVQNRLPKILEHERHCSCGQFPEDCTETWINLVDGGELE